MSLLAVILTAVHAISNWNAAVASTSFVDAAGILTCAPRCLFDLERPKRVCFDISYAISALLCLYAAVDLLAQVPACQNMFVSQL